MLNRTKNNAHIFLMNQCPYQCSTLLYNFIIAEQMNVERRTGSLLISNPRQIPPTQNDNSPKLPVWEEQICTQEWIDKNGLRELKLTSDDLNELIRECSNYTSGQREAALSALYEFEDRLHACIAELSSRMHWMSQVRRIYQFLSV